MAKYGVADGLGGEVYEKESPQVFYRNEETNID